MDNLIEFNGHHIEWLKKPIKNIHLRVYPPDGRITLSTPKRMSKVQLHQYLSDRQEWLHKAVIRMRKDDPCPNFETGSRIWYLGKPFKLIRTQEPGPVTIKKIDDHTLHLNAMTLQDAKTCLNTWYHEAFLALIPALVTKWQTITGKTITNLSIKPMKTRWGSCNILTKRISLNLHLIEKDLNIIEYVLVHEFVHLFEIKHNQRFYQYMERFLPNWQAMDRKMKEKSM